MKKVPAVVCLFLLLLVFPGACREDRPSPANTRIKIGVLLYQMDDPFMSLFASYINDCARAQEAYADIHISVDVLDAKGSQSLQDQQVNRLIEQEYDVLCISIVDRTLASMVIDRAKAADIPIVFFNREPVAEDILRWNKVYYVGSNAEEAGKIQGSLIIRAYQAHPNAWDKNGDGKLQYVILEGDQGHQDSMIRTKSALTALEEAGIEVERLGSQIANWRRSEAETAMTQWLNQLGDQIEMVISNNDNMALGAIDAYRAHNLSDLPMIVGTGAIESALEAIQNGTMVGTVFNDVQSQSQEIFRLAYALTLNEDPVSDTEDLESHYVWTAQRGISAANVAEYLR